MEESRGVGGNDAGGIGEPVAIESLEYGPEAALSRAVELREPLEMAIVADEPAGPILDELFDLIQLGRK
jgi:hypothetical protein